MEPRYRKRGLGLDFEGATPNSHFYTWAVIPTWGEGSDSHIVDRRTGDGAVYANRPIPKSLRTCKRASGDVSACPHGACARSKGRTLPLKNPWAPDEYGPSAGPGVTDVMLWRHQRIQIRAAFGFRFHHIVTAFLQSAGVALRIAPIAASAMPAPALKRRTPASFNAAIGGRLERSALTGRSIVSATLRCSSMLSGPARTIRPPPLARKGVRA